MGGEIRLCIAWVTSDELRAAVKTLVDRSVVDG